MKITQIVSPGNNLSLRQKHYIILIDLNANDLQIVNYLYF